jgi:hypothetical protein
MMIALKFEMFITFRLGIVEVSNNIIANVLKNKVDIAGFIQFSSLPIEKLNE